MPYLCLEIGKCIEISAYVTNGSFSAVNIWFLCFRNLSQMDYR